MYVEIAIFQVYSFTSHLLFKLMADINHYFNYNLYLSYLSHYIFPNYCQFLYF